MFILLKGALMEVYADVVGKKVPIRLMEYAEKDVFMDFNNFLRENYCSYDDGLKSRYCALKDFREIKYVLEKEGYSIEMSSELQKELDKITPSKQTRLVRRVVDQSVLKDGVELYDYQLEDVNFFVQRNRSGNFNDTGLGKTITAITTMSHFFHTGEIEKAFIFVMGSLCYNWKREILMFSRLFEEDNILIVDNKTKLTILDEHTDKKIYIVPYNLAPTIFCNHCERVTGGKVGLFESKKRCRCNKMRVDLKKKLGVQSEMMMICDESQVVMNPKAVTTKVLDSHKNCFEYRHIMTATPYPTGVEQLYAQVRMLDDSILGMTYSHFCRFIANQQGNEYDRDAIVSYNADNISKVIDKVYWWAVKRMKKDIPWFDKNKSIDTIYAGLTAEHQHLYHAFCNHNFQLIKSEYNSEVVASVIVNKFPYISQMLDFPPMLLGKVDLPTALEKKLESFDFNKSGKVLILDDLLKKHMDAGEKVVVADWRPALLDFLAMKYSSHGTEVMHGEQEIPKGMKMNEYRQNIVDRFNDPDSGVNILFVSSIVAGAGFNMNAVCKNLIFFNLSFHALHYMQMQDRIYRITNQHDVNVKVLVYDRTIDLKRYRININREKLNNNLHKNKLMTQDEFKKLFEGVI
jgi:hypothetical protein